MNPFVSFPYSHTNFPGNIRIYPMKFCLVYVLYALLTGDEHVPVLCPTCGNINETERAKALNKFVFFRRNATLHLFVCRIKTSAHLTG